MSIFFFRVSQILQVYTSESSIWFKTFNSQKNEYQVLTQIISIITDFNESNSDISKSQVATITSEKVFDKTTLLLTCSIIGRPYIGYRTFLGNLIEFKCAGIIATIFNVN